MKRQLVGFALLLMILTCSGAWLYAEEPITQKNVSIQFSKGSRTVNAVYANLNDKTVRVESALAKNRVGAVDSLSNIAKSVETSDCEVIAAINGTFFNSYTDNQPVGTIQTRGEFVHLANSGSVVGFTADNHVLVDTMKTTISGAINGCWEYPYNWSAWGLNHLYNDASATTIFTPEFGKTTGAHSYTSVVVQHKIVTEIKKGEASIPQEGFTLVVGPAHIAERFKIGDQVDYRIDINHTQVVNGKTESTPLHWSNVRTTVSAGPTIVKNGTVTADAKAEGFTEDKIHTNRAQRSFIGINASNTLIMGTVPDVTVKELGEIAKNMGLVNAINLDGGASSGLYYKGSYAMKPGRELSNALVITKYAAQPPRIELNSKEVFYDTDPYIYQKRTMVPLRGIMESLGATVSWQASTSSILAVKGDMKMSLRQNSNVVILNGIEKTLEVPVIIKNDRSYVPVRFIVEMFGGTVNWDAQNNKVVIGIDADNANDVFQKAVDAQTNNDLETAKVLYQKTIALNDRHAGAMQKLASIYYKSRDYANAILYYEKYLKIQPNDLSVRSSLGWAYYSVANLEGAEAAFFYLATAQPSTASHWIALSNVYLHYQRKDYVKARDCLNKALTLSLTDAQKTDIQNKLASIPEGK